MTFRTEWEKIYQNQKQMSAWPWSDLVSYVMRYTDPRQSDFCVLELGCGAGANIPFFKKLGVKYYAIEGSPTIVRYLRKNYPDLKDNLVVGDFTREIPFAESFDLVVDRGSLTHNSTASIKNALKMLYPRIRRGGRIVCITLISTETTDFKEGEPAEDLYSRHNFTGGIFEGTGLVHFSDKAHLQELFEQYDLEVMEHTVISQEIPSSQRVFAAWNLVAAKGK